MEKSEKSGEKKLIVLGVTGGIAAYKAAGVTSALTQQGFEVQVIMTANALKLVGEITFRTLSCNKVITDLWEDDGDWRPKHIALAKRADVFAVVPATANFIGKFANGIADDALTTAAVAMRCPVLLAPAMNPDMFKSPAVRHNLSVLKERGVHFIGPEGGHVACGSAGTGRMSDEKDIVDAVKKLL